MTQPLCFTADALHFNETMFCWLLLIPVSLMLNLDISLAYVANFFFICIHSSLPLSNAQRPVYLCFPKIKYFKTAIFVVAWKCNAGDEVTVGGFKECVMMLSGELLNGKLQSSPSRFRSADISLEDDSLFLLLS